MRGVVRGAPDCSRLNERQRRCALLRSGDRIGHRIWSLKDVNLAPCFQSLKIINRCSKQAWWIGRRSERVPNGRRANWISNSNFINKTLLNDSTWINSVDKITRHRWRPFTEPSAGFPLTEDSLVEGLTVFRRSFRIIWTSLIHELRIRDRCFRLSGLQRTKVSVL